MLLVSDIALHNLAIGTVDSHRPRLPAAVDWLLRLPPVAVEPRWMIAALLVVLMQQRRWRSIVCLASQTTYCAAGPGQVRSDGQFVSTPRDLAGDGDVLSNDPVDVSWVVCLSTWLLSGDAGKILLCQTSAEGAIVSRGGRMCLVE